MAPCFDRDHLLWSGIWISSEPLAHRLEAKDGHVEFSFKSFGRQSQRLTWPLSNKVRYSATDMVSLAISHVRGSHVVCDCLSLERSCQKTRRVDVLRGQARGSQANDGLGLCQCGPRTLQTSFHKEMATGNSHARISVEGSFI